MNKVQPSFDQLIAPISPKQFHEEYWEKKHLHISRDDPGFYDGVFSLDDVDRWLHAASRSSSDLLLLTPADGSKLPGKLQHFRPGELSINQVYDAYHGGSSIVINAVQDYWHPLAPVIANLREVFGARVHVNMYLTPPGSKVFPVHADPHDFFIFQVHGAKEWYLHGLGYAPIEKLEYSSSLAYQIDNPWHAMPLLEQLTLRQGDLLYVPRGMAHKGAATADLPSLHLTVSVHPLYWLDLLKAGLEQVCVRHEELRRTLPPGFLTDPQVRERTREIFDRAVQTFHDTTSYEDAVAVILKSQIHQPVYPTDGHFGQLVRLHEITAESELERRQGLLCSVEGADDHAAIRFAASHVRGPAHLREAFDFIRDHRCFRVSDLPGLDDASKVVLARRLIRNGLLRMVRSGEAPRPAAHAEEQPSEAVGATI